MKMVFSVFPVLLFLVFLFLMDSYKLVIKKMIAFSLLWGCVCALFSYLINSFLQDTAGADRKSVV